MGQYTEWWELPAKVIPHSLAATNPSTSKPRLTIQILGISNLPNIEPLEYQAVTFNHTSDEYIKNFTLGSWMNAAPCRPPGGNSPVVMYFRHSIIVYKWQQFTLDAIKNTQMSPKLLTRALRQRRLLPRWVWASSWVRIRRMDDFQNVIQIPCPNYISGKIFMKIQLV